MKTFHLPDGREGLIVEVPKETTSFKLNDYQGHLSFYMSGGESSKHHKLLEGNWQILADTSTMSEEVAATLGLDVRCFSCGGDGKETCNNPDHGFLSAMNGVLNANESRCPVCGHSDDHKIRRYVDGKFIQPDCYECNGTGILNYENAIRLADEYGYDQPLEFIGLDPANRYLILVKG